MLNDKVVPWFQEDGVWLLRILTDEKPNIVEIESTMNSNCSLLWKIDHLKTKARYSQPNGICERFHRTIQDNSMRSLSERRYTIQLRICRKIWINGSIRITTNGHIKASIVVEKFHSRLSLTRRNSLRACPKTWLYR